MGVKHKLYRNLLDVLELTQDQLCCIINIANSVIYVAVKDKEMMQFFIIGCFLLQPCITLA